MKLLKNFPILFILVFFLIGVFYLIIKEVSGSSVNVPAAGPITITGHIICLPHKNSSDIQTAECTFGLEDTSGQYYKLLDNDPLNSTINNLTGDTQIEVQGTFTPQKDKIYKGLGLIEITKVTIMK